MMYNTLFIFDRRLSSKLQCKICTFTSFIAETRYNLTRWFRPLWGLASSFFDGMRWFFFCIYGRNQVRNCFLFTNLQMSPKKVTNIYKIIIVDILGYRWELLWLTYLTQPIHNNWINVFLWLIMLVILI